MEVGAIAAVISVIVAIYALLVWYIGTRWLVRTVTDQPQRVQRIEVLFVNRAKLN